ncbi:MAG: Cell envelope-related transcriptional attenuator [Candidatus Woesebacteria bacterium GW2011_GWA1_39_8]|jgi:LCP family protein required for cell wall assembly|uniref:Cell envelope-related transcriptional attenuator n=1 Tax=Candidatus Woesebacteria bacterium GW2011_GWA1_39_8 TaxID=1618552 RepID=A0A0G0PPS5_9BACT|nr:MAG: Cell envelope-related transcriptional attenuator [Candidatus Woesebacteria bacterium GW2011_GWA1_39_8]
MKKKIITGAFFVVLFLFSLIISYLFGIYSKVHVKSNVSANNPLVTATPTPTPDPLGVRNILLLGYGGAGHEGALLTDTMIVAHVEPRNDRVILISIPRDIWIPIPITSNSDKLDKINHAYSIPYEEHKYPNLSQEFRGPAGGGTLSKLMVEKVTGLHIDNFVAINFSGFKTIIDNLGGVSVSVPFAFTDNFYPLEGMEDETCDKADEDIKALTATMSGFLLEQQFPCRYEELHFDKGVAQMDGETALKFVRSRHSDINGSDFGRTLRQQAFIIGIKNKLLQYKSITKIISTINLVSNNITTDIDIPTAVNLLKDQGSVSDVTIKTISLNTDNVLRETFSGDGQYILLPQSSDSDWSSIKDYIKENIDKIDSKESSLQ